MKRRASKTNATTGRPITQDDINSLLDQQNGLCAYCQCKLDGNFHVDHFVPLAKDGEHAADNIVLACSSCNLQKGALNPVEFMEKKPPSKIKTTEAREQSLVIVWSHKRAVRELMPALRWLHHSPNGEKRDIRTGNKLKALGVKPGFPDLILPARAGDSPGLIIEMKSDTGRASDAQKEWIEHFKAQGWETAIARSSSEARTILCEYLGITPEAAPALDA